MLSTDAAWAAGIIDGEGCILIERHHRTKFKATRSPRHKLTVRVGMIHLPTIERLQALFGGHVYYRELRSKSVSWNWVVDYQFAANVLEIIAPYSVTKKAQVLLGLAFHLNKGNGIHPIGGAAPKGQRMDAALLEAREQYYQQMRDLKKEVV